MIHACNLKLVSKDFLNRGALMRNVQKVQIFESGPSIYSSVTCFDLTIGSKLSLITSYTLSEVQDISKLQPSLLR